MYSYQIPRAEKEPWCRITRGKLVNYPDRKFQLNLQDIRHDIAEVVGNIIANKIIANNAAEKILKWVSPSGPED